MQRLVVLIGEMTCGMVGAFCLSVWALDQALVGVGQWFCVFVNALV